MPPTASWSFKVQPLFQTPSIKLRGCQKLGPINHGSLRQNSKWISIALHCLAPMRMTVEICMIYCDKSWRHPHEHLFYEDKPWVFLEEQPRNCASISHVSELRIQWLLKAHWTWVLLLSKVCLGFFEHVLAGLKSSWNPANSVVHCQHLRISMDFNDHGCKKHTKDAATNPPSLVIWPQFIFLWRCFLSKIAAAAHVLVLGAFPARIAIFWKDDDPDGREHMLTSMQKHHQWPPLTQWPTSTPQPLFHQVSWIGSSQEW